MKLASFVESDNFAVAILVNRIHKDEIQKAYLEPFPELSQADFCILDLHQSFFAKKTPAAEMKSYIEEDLAPYLQQLGVKYVVCTDAGYFKVLTKVSKVDINLGYVLDSAYGSWKVVYAPAYTTIFHDPEKAKPKINQAMTALANHMADSYTHPGEGIIHSAQHPKTIDEIKEALEELLSLNCDLTIDIEAFSLKHHTAGIGSIAFAVNENNGISFLVDYVPIEGAVTAPYGTKGMNLPVRALLKDFFTRYVKRAIYHNISYDVYVLIYQLFMSDLLDTKGLLNGMDSMLTNWEDTKLITYLATNSCAGNKLSLKDQAQEFAGNYAESEIENITFIPPDKLLKYNLTDACSTWFVYNKHWETMLADNQQDIYENLFKPAIKDIVQMQLTGLPINMNRVLEVQTELQVIEETALKTIKESPIVLEYVHTLNERWVDNFNTTRKKKRVTLDEANEVFNPNSPIQLQDLLFNVMELPVLGLTATKQPSTDGDTIKVLQAHTKNPLIISFLDALVEFKAVNKILTSFIPAMLNAAAGKDGWHYLSGNFNLGGTVSGRLSSSDPNLQNLPSNIQLSISEVLMSKLGSTSTPLIKKGKLHLGKLIKTCVQPPPGWIFCGLDFDSLEDKISALTTKDKNKLKVYLDGYDGHSLRAYSYFKDQCIGIEDTLESINSIAEKYPLLRQESKAPTFALTYGGQYFTLMKNCGFTEEVAKKIEANYHVLYAESDKWVQDKLDEAARLGYVTAAFGLRVRTPLLAQVVRGTRKTPYEAEAEGRTAGNALGQSWCLLNSRACSEFMGKVRVSKYQLDIRPCAQIHDAQYYLVRDAVDALLYVNQHLVKAVQWQDDPAIQHPTVGLSGKLSIFHPNWSVDITVPNDISEAELFELVLPPAP